MSDLVLEDVSYHVGSVGIIHNISLEIASGKLVGLLGANGSGKTSLMKLIAGLLHPQQGKIYFRGRDIHQEDIIRRAKYMSYLPQFQPLDWPILGREVVMLGRLPYRTKHEDNLEAVKTAMQQCHVTEFSDYPVSQLSGGEQVSIMLARFLATQASLLLADEPIQSLDPARQIEIMEVLLSESRKGKIVLIILHDLTFAKRYCDQVILLRKGMLYAEGIAENVLNRHYIRDVFDIEVDCGHQEGREFIIPLRSYRKGS